MSTQSTAEKPAQRLEELPVVQGDGQGPRQLPGVVEAVLEAGPLQLPRLPQVGQEPPAPVPVSYTHLTLPTIYSV